jgi:hypothetical protein
MVVAEVYDLHSWWIVPKTTFFHGGNVGLETVETWLYLQELLG